MAMLDPVETGIAPFAADEVLSLAERAHRRLRDAILGGALAAGGRVSERALGRSLGVCAQRVRETLRRLQAEGLVVTSPRRGTEVAELDARVLGEMNLIRMALGGGAAALAALAAPRVGGGPDAPACPPLAARRRPGRCARGRDEEEASGMTTADPRLREALNGISGILVTPFDAADRPAPARLAPVVDRAVRAGVHVLVANGNTSEFYGLTTAEAEAMVHGAAEQVAGRVPLLAGVGRSVGDARALARASRAAGADALMVHQPPDPFVSPRGVAAYVQRIAEGLAAAGLRVTLLCAAHGRAPQEETVNGVHIVRRGGRLPSPRPLRAAPRPLFSAQLRSWSGNSGSRSLREPDRHQAAKSFATARS